MKRLIQRTASTALFAGSVVFATVYGYGEPVAQNGQSFSFIAQPAAQAATVGQFQGAGRYTLQGGARVVTENGQRYLELTDNFRSSGGPDLFVLLHRQDQPTRYQQQDYVNLGKLQRTNGAQRYAIPAGVNINQFRSVVVWCRAFDVTFGYGALSQ